MIIKIKKLSEDAIIPSYAKPGDAAMDLTAVEIKETSDYIEYITNIAVEIPEDYVGLVFPRSSNSKKDLLLCNSVGVIDSGYRNSINLRYKNIKHNGNSNGTVFDMFNVSSIYSVGERVGQLMIIPRPFIEFEEVENLEESARGMGGFGSTNAV